MRPTPRKLPEIIAADSRGRLSLGAFIRHEYYIPQVKKDGTIILTPAVFLTAREVADEN